MECPACGTENQSGAKFCVECGAALALRCPSCGTGHRNGQRFCAECGAPLSNQSQILLSPETAAAERRLVSVLFADLVGFTGASEQRDAEDTRELLSRYFETCRRLIELYGGTVEKFIGDAVMAVWGTPVAQEDDAERSVRAALDLVAAVSALGNEIGSSELRARAGVLTGEAAVTIGAQGQGMVAGDLVNTASRIQAVAEPGTVLVGDSTRRAAEAAIAFEREGEFELKGKTEAVPLFRALRVTAGRGGALKSVGVEAPFAGRDRELRLVKELFHASADERRAHLVSVVGIAGIGKSRLAWEFFKYIDGLSDVVWWHRGRCLAYGEGVAYWALAEMVRMRAGIMEGEEVQSARQKLRAAVDEHIPDRDERTFVEPRLAQLLGLEERANQGKEELFGAWRLLFERMSQQAPVVLLFEDLQWADVALVEFLTYLLEWSRTFPIFVLCHGRPEFQERHPELSASSRNHTTLFLEPLSREVMSELLEGFVPGLPADLRERVLARAEGVPLYAVETVRMLLDRGLLAEKGGVYQPTGPIEELDVPETLQGLISARLDGLGQSERQLLQDASVLGKTFTSASLAALSGLDEHELEVLLVSLVRKEVLGVQIDPRSPERGQYGFLQDLVRRIAYETIGRRERKVRHLAAAAHLEETFGDVEQEIVEVVAAHYLAAYEMQVDDEDAEEIKRRARDTLARAGERAASLAAHEEAQRYFEQAANLADGTERAMLRERAGATAFASGRFVQAEEHLASALETWESADDAEAAARVSARLAEVEWQGGKLDSGLARMEAAFEVLAKGEPDPSTAELAAQLARLHYFNGELEVASARVEVALRVAATLWLPELLAEALISKGLILDAAGRVEESLAHFHHGVRIALDHDLPTTAGRGYVNLSATLNDRDRYEEAIAHARKGLELVPRFGSRVFESHLSSNMGEALVQTGRWDEALESERGISVFGLDPLVHSAWIAIQRGELDEATRIVEEHPSFGQARDVQDRSYVFAMRAELLRSEGKIREALAAAEEAFAAARAISANVTRPTVEVLEAALAAGELGRVEEIVAEVEGQRPGERTPSLTGQAARFRAKLTIARGMTEGVEGGFRTAAAIFREFGLVFWLAVTELESGEWLADEGRTQEAEADLAEAQGIFERLDARPWLERLAKVGGARIEVPA